MSTAIEQRTDEWFAARCGHLTASRLHEAIAKTRSGWGASRANVKATIIAERLTHTVAEGFSNAAMQWGIDQEGEARRHYEFMHDVTVCEVGFVKHPYIIYSGASPDGLVGDDGLVEIKCPNTATHIETLKGGSIPEKYIVQMQWQMACTGRKWCDFASFDPRLPAEMQLHVTRVERDDTRIAELETLAQEFLSEVAAAVSELNDTYRPRPDADANVPHPLTAG